MQIEKEAIAKAEQLKLDILAAEKARQEEADRIAAKRAE